MADNKRIKGTLKDFGEKIGGAVKDDALKESVTKNVVWDRPDYVEVMKQGGFTPEYTMYVKYMRDKLPNKPYNQVFGDVKYEAFLQACKNYLTSKDDVEVKNMLLDYTDQQLLSSKIQQYIILGIVREISKMNLPYDVYSDFVYTEKRYQEVLKKFLIPVGIADYLKQQVQIQNFPEEFKAIKKNLYTEVTEDEVRIWNIRSLAKPKMIDKREITEEERNNIVDNKGSIVKDYWGKHREYIDKEVVPVLERNRNQLKALRQQYERRVISSDQVKRAVVEDYRKGKDTHGGSMMEAFDFRGGEFGNWLNDKERIVTANSCYDALGDLARTLRVNPEFIASRFQTERGLAIAFGARGRSRALAHYEPGRKVINLTKQGGAGTLAHEFGHCLDNTLAKKMLKNTLQTNGSVKSRTYLTEIVSGNQGVKYDDLGDLSVEELEIAKAMVELVQTIKYAEHTPEQKEEIISRITNEKLRAEPLYIDLEKVVKGGMNSLTVDEQISLNDSMTEYVTDTGENREQIFLDDINNLNIDEEVLKEELEKQAENRKKARKEAEKQYDVKERFTQLYQDCLAVDTMLSYSAKSAYYSDTQELFARCFEQYIAKEIVERLKGNNDFLVYGIGRVGPVENSYAIYPEGEEREKIHAKMAKLVDLVIKYSGEENLDDADIIRQLQQASEVPYEDYVETKDRFLLTVFKDIAQTNGLKPTREKTPRENGKYKINFEDKEVNYVEVPIILNKDPMIISMVNEEVTIENSRKTFLDKKGYVKAIDEITSRIKKIKKEKEAEEQKDYIRVTSIIGADEKKKIVKQGFNRDTQFIEGMLEDINLKTTKQKISISVHKDYLEKEGNFLVAKNGLKFDRASKKWLPKTARDKDYEKENADVKVVITGEEIENSTDLRREITRIVNEITGRKLIPSSNNHYDLLNVLSGVGKHYNERQTPVGVNVVDLTKAQTPKKGIENFFMNRNIYVAPDRFSVALGVDERLQPEEYTKQLNRQYLEALAIIVIDNSKISADNQRERVRVIEGLAQALTKLFSQDIRSYFTDSDLYKDFWDNAPSTKKKYLLQITEIFKDVLKVIKEEGFYEVEK